MFTKAAPQTSKTIAIIFGVGFSIYLIYLNTILTTNSTKDISEYKINKLFKQQDLRSISKCGRYPALGDLNITDTYWQVTNTTNGTFYLYNAYFDNREGLKNISVIRILGLINKIHPIVKTNCQLWYEGLNQPIISEIYEYRLLWRDGWGENKKGASPYLISCKNPLHSRGLVPQHVSLTEGRCDAANNVMEIRNKRPKDGHKKHFIVSVKAVDFDNDVSLLLIEWCEILKILGVDKVDIFVINAHVNVIRILEFYQNEGLVNLKFLKYPHELPNKVRESWHQWSQNDLVPYHDTFYENLYNYEFMVPMDIDEFIMPIRTEDRSWMDLMKRTIERSNLENRTVDAYPVQNRYFLLKSIYENQTYEGIPREFRFLSNIYRAEKITPAGGNAKTFMKTDRVVTVHNHFPFSCFEPYTYCQLYDVHVEDGHLSHYRTDCDNPECKESKAYPTKDTTLWKFKDEILKGFEETIEKLKLFESDIEGTLIF